MIKNRSKPGLAWVAAAGLTAVVSLFTLPLKAQSSAPSSGTWYSTQHPEWPPTPANLLGLEAAEVSPGIFWVNDLDVNYDELNQLSEFMSSAPEPPGGGGGGTGGSPIETEPPDPIPMIPVLLSSCNVGLLPPLYQVTNVILTLTNVETNGVYDLFTTPTLSPPSWRWLTRTTNGQTSFIVTNPPASQSYFAAACTNALQQWLIGSVGVVTNAPDRVTAWLDQSGNTNHAFVRLGGSDDQRPYWITNVINGLPVVHFYGSNNFQTNLTSTVTNWTAAEAFVVLRVVSESPSTSPGLWIMGSTADANRYPDSVGQIVETFGTKSARRDLGSTSQSLTNFHLLNVLSQPGEWTARLNASVKYTTVSNEVGFTSTPKLGIGNGGSFVGDIAELLIYNRALTPSERKGVSSYLNQRYKFIASPPQAPTNITANVLSPRQISLWWNTATNNEQTIYRVDRGTDGTNFTQIAEVEGASFIDSGLATNVLYYYRVKAKNLAGDSVYSTAVSGTTLTSGTDMLLDSGTLKLWLKADHGAPVNHDRTLNTWLDVSGNTNTLNLANYDPTRRPFWFASTNTLNGHPVVRFFRTNWFQILFTSPITNWTSAEAFVVLRATSATNANNPGLWRIGQGNSEYPNAEGNIQETFATSRFTLITNLGNVIASPHLFNPYSKTGDWTAMINGTIVYGPVTNAAVAFYAGAPNLGNGLNPFDGDIVECLIYKQVLTIGQRSTTSDYLRQKYNLW